MSRWQRLAAAFPLVMSLIDQADALRKFVGDKSSTEYDNLVADFVDGVVSAIETAVGQDVIDNAKLRAAILAALDVPLPKFDSDPSK